MVLISQVENLIISPDIKSVLPIVNFALSEEGLTQQLLWSAVKKDNPELEEKRISLLHEEDSLKRQLNELQEIVLKELALSQGNILSNKDLFNSLEKTKRSSSAVQQALNDSKKVQNEIDKECSLYRTLANFGANMYFVCNSLLYINSIYIVPLEAYFKLFQDSLVKSKSLSTMKEKCQYFLHEVYNYTARFLLKEDRLVFAVLLINKLYPEVINKEEWSPFLGKILLEGKPEASELEDNLPSWFESSHMKLLQHLKMWNPELYRMLNIKSEKSWQDFMESDKLIQPKTLNLSSFQLVLMTKILRPDLLYTAISNFACTTLGLTSLSPKSAELDNILDESVPEEPILLILVAGSDPSEYIYSLAAKRKLSYLEVSLGENIEESLTSATSNGIWLIIKNLHLQPSWFYSIKKSLISVPSFHDNFRLWITTEPHQDISLLLLQNSLKLCFELPGGLRSNVERTYKMWSGFNPKGDVQTKTMFFVAWLHAVIQERRFYIPQGWVQFYEFNDADLNAAFHYVKYLFNDNQNIELRLNILRGLLDEAIYGGRIDNTSDHLVLTNYIREIFDTSSITSSKSKIQLGPGVQVSFNLFEEKASFFKQLPDINHPQYFGLSNMVERQWQQMEGLKIVNKLKGVDEGEENFKGEKFSIKKWSNSLSPFLKYWKTLYKDLNFPQTDETEWTNFNSPLTSFLTLELIFASQLVRKIHFQLVTISKVMKGADLPTISIQNMIESISKQKTPEPWMKMWQGPEVCTQYVNTVTQKCHTLINMRTKQLLTEANVNLCNFFNPTSLISSLILQISGIKDLNFWDVKLILQYNGSLKLSGVRLEGATIEENKIVTWNKQVSTTFINVDLEALEKHILDSYLKIPVYASYRRQQIISNVFYKCDPQEQSFWIKAGVAFVLTDI